MNAYNATIGGLQYTLNVVKDEAWMRRLTASVDARIHEIRDALPAVGATQVAVLAFLNAMHDYYELERERDDMLAALEQADPAAAARYRSAAPRSSGADAAAAGSGRRTGNLPVSAAVPTAEAPARPADAEPVSDRAAQPIRPSAGDRDDRSPGLRTAAGQTPESGAGDGRSVNPFAAGGRPPAHPKRAPGVSIDPITGKARPPRQPASTAIDPLAPKRPKAVSADVNNPFASYKKETSYAVDPLTGEPRPPRKHPASGAASAGAPKPGVSRGDARHSGAGESESAASDTQLENRLRAERAWAAGQREMPVSGRETRVRETGRSGQAGDRRESREPLKGKRINPFLPR